MALQQLRKDLDQMTDIYFDTEFIDDGTTIKLISIGMVAEDGRELYRVVDDVRVISEAVAHPWLRENVIPSLPIMLLPDSGSWDWATMHPDFSVVAPRDEIAADVRNFVLSYPDPQLWAWYAAYDHVALAQLFGPMSDLPDGIPMFTNDIRQECRRLGDPQMPEQPAGEHNALADAHHNHIRARFLHGYASV
jgi:hypothetical protein